LPRASGLILSLRPVKKKPGYPGSADPGVILSGKVHMDSQDTQG
jgi:hypothetical protein